MRKLYTALFLLIAFSPIQLFSQKQKNNPFQVGERIIAPSNELSDLIRNTDQHISEKGAIQIYLIFNIAPNRTILASQGIYLENIVQSNIYTASISQKITSQTIQNTGIIGWSEVNAQDKINPLLKENAGNTADEKDVLISVIGKTTTTTLQAVLTQYKGRLTPQQLWKDQHIWEVKIPASNIAAIAENPFILSITPNFIPKPLEYQANGLNNNQISQQPIIVGGHNLHGDGVVIGVGDNSDPVHVDYQDRITAFNPVFDGDHGFLTTGAVGGNGLVDERYKGVANKCTLISDFFSQIITNAPHYHSDFNMVVSNNSYANIVNNCGYAGTYDVYSQFTDQQMIDNPTMLHVFAAGNDGFNTCAPFPTSMATMAGSYSSAKNELTVGGFPKQRIFTGGNPYSSKGPVKDGRIKPEISSVGDRLYTTTLNNDYIWATGTSLASPTVAGGAGLLYQRYRQMFGNQDPKSALIKNLLMNGASDFGIPGPDYSYGFGMMNVGHSLIMLDSNRIFTNTTNTNTEQSYTFTVPANTAKAKVMLYWNDPAAAPLSGNTLINDLDLTVTSPSNIVSLPLVLNPAAAHVLDTATAAADHTNNVEQVTLTNPAAGNYTIKVKGFNVPEINQEYFVSYDFIPVGITIQYPFGGEAALSADSIILYWEASDDANTFTISYSLDNGTNWNIVNNNVGAGVRDFSWFPPPSVSSNQCIVRISRNNTTQFSQSKTFTLSTRAVATLNPTNEQCPGSIKINWNAITGATNYHLFKKIGADMVDVATVTGTTYTFSGLSLDTTYWVAVAPNINGSIGMRSVAISRLPLDGQCAGIANHGDLRVGNIIAPVSGRLFTSTALTNTQPLIVGVNNLDNQTASNYRISYKINSGAWTSFNYTNPIAASTSTQITVDNLNLSAVGNYTITVAISNLAIPDPVTNNDTLQTTIQQIDNPVMNLIGGYNDGFESNVAINLVGKNMIGLNGNTKWDWAVSKPHGRLKNFVNSGVTLSGSKSMSLDNDGNQSNDIAGSSYNTLTGTFNLSTFTGPNTEIRGDFDYVMSGIPKFDTGNSVWIRGADTDPWIHLMDYQIDSLTGAVFHSGSLQLSDKLTAAGQTFSTSTQIKFTQYDTSRIESTYYGNGVTIDNFKLYSVTDDVAMLSVDSVFHYNCGLSAQIPLKVKVVNGVNNTIHNIALSYKIDNGAVVTEMLDSIPGNDTVQYTFNQTMDLSTAATYQLSTWVYVATDNYRLNDSIIDFTIINQPVITSFPYLENFESGEGFYYAEGAKSSWQYGTPASPIINHAASGSKAWKTNLAGNYNSNEFSFLYSPCFDISHMAHPTLSFNLGLDVEPPGTTIYDRAYVEYSHDGQTWQKLGAEGQGFNWYNNDSAQAWTEQGLNYWHVATIPLPNDAPIVSFRIVLHSDPGTEYEGIAIDDIHVYDLIHPIFNQSQFANAITQPVNANQQVDFIEANDIGASVLTGNVILGNTAIQDYKHTQFINEDSTQYYLPKNFTVQTSSAPTDSATVRFYVPEEAVAILRNDSICVSCSKVKEVQSLGITKYDDPDKSVENNTLADNINGSYEFIPKNKIAWVPYDIGYYAETKVKTFSEFWFNDGGPTHDQTLQTNIFDFTVTHLGDRYAQLKWTSAIDASSLKYELQRSQDSINFIPFATINAVEQNGHSYILADTPTLNNRPVIFYRIKYTLQDSTEHYSLTRSLDWTISGGIVTIYPNPSNGALNLNWFKGTGDALQWSVYNSIGKRLLMGTIDQNTYNGSHKFDFSQMGITHGVYILKIISGKQEWKFKIVFD